MTARFAYMTNSVPNLQAARKLALAGGHTVDMLPPDAPAPEPGTYDGIMVDFLPTARYALTRKTYLEKLARIAKVVPILVFDQSTNYREAALMRAAGIKWLPVLKPQGFDMLLAHPLAKSPAKAEPDGEPSERAGSGATSAAE
jgi:hypothetical protein